MNRPASPERRAISRLEDELGQELERIPGVLAATVWLRDRELVREVYVTGAPGTSAFLLERAVSSILERHGLEFDAGQITIAPLDADIAPAPPWRGRFLILEDIEVTRAERRVTCRVRILRHGMSVTGVGHDIDTEHGGARAAVLATLRAAELAASGIALGLEGLEIPEFFGRRYVMVSIEAAFARRRSHLPGIAAIAQSTEHAACLAALGAIERWLAW